MSILASIGDRTGERGRGAVGNGYFAQMYTESRNDTRNRKL